jgi:hypothetical protein
VSQSLLTASFPFGSNPRRLQQYHFTRQFISVRTRTFSFPVPIFNPLLLKEFLGFTLNYLFLKIKIEKLAFLVAP